MADYSSTGWLNRFLTYLTFLIFTNANDQVPFSFESNLTSNNDKDTIPSSIREHWMRAALDALSYSGSPCPFEAFGAVIVNHTDNPQGRLICTGVNEIKSGNPTLHGEIAAINNCSSILTDPSGQYKLNGSQAMQAWRDLSLYTTAEACPMCASAIQWAGLKEYIYGISQEGLREKGWGLIDVESRYIFKRSGAIGTKTEFIGSVLSEECKPYFAWQFDEKSRCPGKCTRLKDGGCGI